MVSFCLVSVLRVGGQETPGGTIIRNQSNGSFRWSNVPYAVSSNQVETIILASYGLSITPDGDTTTPGQIRYVSPGGTAVFGYVLTNTGTYVDSFDLVATTVAGPGTLFTPDDIRIYADTNQNGILDPGEATPVSSIGPLNPDQYRHLLVLVDIPADAAGSVAYINLTGTSQGDPGETDDDNVALASVEDNAQLTIRKSVNPVQTIPGGTVTYTLEVWNIGSGTTLPETVEVDGGDREGILIRDPIPEFGDGHTEFVHDSLTAAPNIGIALASTDDGATWTELTSGTPAANTITDIAFLLETDLQSGQSAKVTFQVLVASDIGPQVIDNIAYVQYRDSNDEPREDYDTNTLQVVVPQPPGAVLVGPLDEPDAVGVEDLNGDQQVDNNDDAQNSGGIRPAPEGAEEVEEGAPVVAAIEVQGEEVEVAGNWVIFHNTVMNNGVAPDVLNIEIDDDLSNLPDGWAYQLMAADGITLLQDTNGDTIADVGEMDPGEQRNFVVRVFIPPDAPLGDNNGEGFRTAVMACSALQPDVCNLTWNIIDAIVSPADVWEPFVKSQELPENPKQGDTVIYTNYFGNSTNSDLTDVLVVDELDDALTNIRDVTTGMVSDLNGVHPDIQVIGTYDAMQHRTTWYFPVIPPGFEGETTFTADFAEDAESGAEITNVYQITSAQTQDVYESNEVAAVLNVDEVVRITKKANANTVEIGDPVLYTVTLTNESNVTLETIELTDYLPRGFRYHEDSAEVNEAESEPMEGDEALTLHWDLPDLPPGESITVTYVTIATADSVNGDGENTAVATGKFPGGTPFSVEATERVEPTEGMFANRSIVIGKVFIDQNDNRLQDNAEPGIANVRLYMEDGTYVLTDSEGKYHFEGIRPGRHVIRLDQTTLPEGFKLGIIDSENALTPHSRFLTVRWGTMHKANFRVLPGADLNAIPTTPSAILQPLTIREDGPRTRVTLQADSALTGLWIDDPVSGVTHILLPEVAQSLQLSQDALSDPNLEEIRVFTAEDGSGSKLQLRWRNRTSGYPPVQISRVEGRIEVVAGHETAADNDPRPRSQIMKDANEPRILRPLDGQAFLVHDQIEVEVALSLTASSRLYVNDQLVGEEKIGTRQVHVRDRLSHHVYSGVPIRQGSNTLRFVVKNAGEKDEREVVIQVIKAAAPAEITITVKPEKPMADGRTEPVVELQLLDEAGLLTGHGSVLTLSTDLGTIQSRDLYPGEPGHQVQVLNGRAMLRLSAATEPETRTLTVHMGELKRELEVKFTPHLRPWIIVGLVEATFGEGKRQDYGDGGSGGDGAHSFSSDAQDIKFFGKGRVPWDMVLTLGYDDNGDYGDGTIFRERDPLATYPVFGDSTEQGYEAESRDKLYVKLEKDESFLLYGDFETGLDQTKLLAYERSFTGTQLHLSTDYVDVDAFASENDQAQVRIEMRGDGTSGWYDLPDTDLILNSERIVIETRDRFHPDVVLESESRGRYTDYSIDYERGRILFKRRVPSKDVNQNPVYIVITYEVDGRKKKDYWVYGGRAALHSKDRRFDLGVTHITEESNGGDYTLEGADGTVAFTEWLTLHAEYGRTETAEGIEDEAYLAELVGEHDFATFRLWYEDVGDDYENTSIRGSTIGRRTIGLEGTFALSEEWHLNPEIYTQREESSGRERDVAILDLLYSQDAGSLLFGGGWIDEGPFSNSATDLEDKEAVFGRLGLNYKLSKRLDIDLLHQQAFGDNDTDQPTRSEAVLNYQLDDFTRLSIGAEHRYLNNGSTELNGIFGIEKQINESLQSYQRLRLDDAASGRTIAAGSGLAFTHKLGPEWSVDIAGEMSNAVHREDDDTVSDDDDFWALAVSAGYTPLDGQSTAVGRYELRVDEEAYEHLFEIGGTVKLTDNYTLFGRNLTTWEDKLDDTDEWEIDLLFGLAYRPVDYDRLNVLAALELIYEDGTQLAGGETLQKAIFSTDANWQLCRDLVLQGKYAIKVTDADFADDIFITDVKALFLRYDMSDRFFVGAGGRVLSQYESETHMVSYGAEFGMNVRKNMRVAVGYNFEGFEDEDFDRGEYYEEGFYLSLTYKFDESIFGIFGRLAGEEEGRK